jgi:spermidine/putrescine-binding protein
MSFTDGYGIPTGADNPDSAYAFINQVLDPKVNPAISRPSVRARQVDPGRGGERAAAGGFGSSAADAAETIVCMKDQICGQSSGVASSV